MEEIVYHDSGRLFERTDKVLLAVDGSEGASRAAAVAFELSEMTRAKLFILHVINVGAVQQIASMSDTSDIEIMRHYMENGKKLLQGYKNAAKDFDIEIELLLEKGLPSDKIVSVAKDNGVEIIVMGASGITGERKGGLGSSTERVIRRSVCPVLVVK